MESKYQCPFCKYMSLKKWNVKKHVKNVHGIKNFPNANIKIANIDPQNIRHPPCSIHSSDYRSNQEQQHDVIPHYQSKYEPSQEKHQYGKRFKDVSTQYSENHINHSTRLGRTGFKGEVDSQLISQQDSSNHALKLAES